MDTARSMTTDIVPLAGDMVRLDDRYLGQMANKAAALHAFGDYRIRKAENTLRRQDADLALFGEYLAEVGNPAGDLARDAGAWWGITWGLVQGFIRWMLLKGYAVGTVNVRLSTVRTYAGLAARAGTLEPEELALIRTVSGYSHKEAQRVDEKRDDVGLPTRQGRKKAQPVSLSPAQAKSLKSQPDTPQGRRDRLIVCLLLNHGLRVGEVAGLTVGDVDLKARELRFYREKVDRQQTHRLTPDTLEAARAYLTQDALPIGPLLRASRKDGSLTEAGMTARRISSRVKTLGRALGLYGLSAHDCRHWWATQAARAGTPIDRLQDAGGWASPAMPLRYVEAAKIANEGVRLE